MGEKIRAIPDEDMIFSFWDDRLDEEYKDGVFCSCGGVIKFKNRELFETVFVVCPSCKRSILYG